MGQLRLFQAKVDAASTASEVAGKNIGRYGLFYITLIVLVGIGASVYLDESKIAAVIGLVSAALTGIIAMLAKVAEVPLSEDSDKKDPGRNE